MRLEKNLKLFVCFELTIRNGTFRIQSIMDIECILTTLSVFVYPFKFLGGYGFERIWRKNIHESYKSNKHTNYFNLH